MLMFPRIILLLQLMPTWRELHALRWKPVAWFPAAL